LRLKDFTILEQVVLALSLIFVGLLLIDPFMLERARALPPEARNFFRTITDIGRSNWMLIPTGAAIALALVLQKRHLGFRNAPAYGLIASTIGYVFVSVGGAGLIANIAKNIIGRARPKLFDSMGPLEFKMFAFAPDYASLPSGHATNIFAFATVIAILWPRGRVLLYTLAAWIAASRVLIGQHYVTDVVLGAILGTVFPYVVRDRFAARRWLFERTPEGGYRIRGARTQRWLGWPQGKRPA
jgi:undecaprenyl-diphosphatase